MRQEGGHLVCAACHCAYSVIDCIPVLIAARAEKLPD
jgi:uncharacterized protein YbaR (Trm112 family)